MRRFLCGLLVLTLLGAAAPLTARAEKVERATPPDPKLVIRYYGHAFVYLITTTGVRIAIDPFSEDAVKYPFPPKLQADVVLVSNEADDHNGSSRLFGSPQVFRSITAIGMNNARGFLFKGVQTYRDKDHGAQRGTNAAFTFKIDGLRFAHLGGIGHVPDASQRQLIGPVDVLFLPVGNLDLSVAELNKIAADLGARIIVPIKYKTPLTGDLDLRELPEFLKGTPAKVQDLHAAEFTLGPADLPAQPTVYVLTPAPAASAQ